MSNQLPELGLPYVPSNPRIESTPQYMAFVDALDLHGDRAVAMGMWMLLRNYAANNPNMRGSIGKMSPKRLAHELSWRGDPAVLYAALVQDGKSGLLIIAEDGELCLFDWGTSGGRVLNDRVRKRVSRNHGLSPGNRFFGFPEPPENPPGGFPPPSGRVPVSGTYEQEQDFCSSSINPYILVNTEDSSLQNCASADQAAADAPRQGEVVGFIGGEEVSAAEVFSTACDMLGTIPTTVKPKWANSLVENGPYSRAIIALAWRDVGRICQENGSAASIGLFVRMLVAHQKTMPLLALGNAPRIDAKAVQRRQAWADLEKRPVRQMAQ